MKKIYIYFSVSVVHMLWNKISPSFIEKQGKCILAAQRIGKFEYWIFTQPNKNIFSLIFLCEGTERNFYFKRKFKICFLCHSSSRFNILQFKSRVLQIKIINHLSPDWIYILCRILFQNESLSSKDKMYIEIWNQTIYYSNITKNTYTICTDIHHYTRQHLSFSFFLYLWPVWSNMNAVERGRKITWGQGLGRYNLSLTIVVWQ